MLFDRSTPKASATPVSAPDDLSVPHPELCFDRLDALISASKKEKGAVIKLHMENFKSFNDTFGFNFGELLLKEIGGFLKGVQSAEVYRTSGVEFVLIFNNMSHTVILRNAGEIGQRFEESWRINGLDCMCSMNMALAYYPGHAASAREMMENLSRAINESERVGQNQLVVFGEELKQKLFRANNIAMQIPRALEDGSLELRYRPSYCTAANRFTRADCNMRLLSGQFGIVNGDELIAIAEESGQINSVTQYAVTRTCKLIADLLSASKDFETISVPVSPIQFMQEHFVDDVRAAVKEAGIPASYLALQVTESVAITAFASARIRINELADMGVEIILTHFGTGNSSIISVLDLPIKAVKLDRMFIWQLENDERVPPLAEGLVYISKKLGLKLIAEGVETETQSQLLDTFGCEYKQGFSYSSSITGNELINTFNTKA